MRSRLLSMVRSSLAERLTSPEQKLVQDVAVAPATMKKWRSGTFSKVVSTTVQYPSTSSPPSLKRIQVLAVEPSIGDKCTEKNQHHVIFDESFLHIDAKTQFKKTSKPWAVADESSFSPAREFVRDVIVEPYFKKEATAWNPVDSIETTLLSSGDDTFSKGSHCSRHLTKPSTELGWTNVSTGNTSPLGWFCCPRRY